MSLLECERSGKEKLRHDQLMNVPQSREIGLKMQTGNKRVSRHRPQCGLIAAGRKLEVAVKLVSVTATCPFSSLLLSRFVAIIFLLFLRYQMLQFCS